MPPTAGAAPDTPSLLFDQNLAPSLPRRLAELYPGSAHVRDAGLAAADDVEAVLRARQADVVAFAADESSSLLVLVRRR